MWLTFKSAEIFQESHWGSAGAGEDVFTLMENIRGYFKRLNSTTKLPWPHNDFSVHYQDDFLANYLRKFEDQLGLEL